MPDRYGERDEPQLGDDDTPPDELPTYGPTDTEIRAQAIHNCPLCDDDGYRRLTVCDHTDSAARGIAAVRAALAARAQRPREAPENAPTEPLDGKTTPL